MITKKFDQYLNTLVDTAVTETTVAFSAGPGTDYFRDPASDWEIANAPAMMCTAPRDFTFSVTIAPEFGSMFDAGTIFLYSSDQYWFKFAYEMSDRDAPFIVSVATRGKSDDCNGEKLTGAPVRFRVSRKGDTYGMYYATGPDEWMMHRLLSVPEESASPFLIGLSVQSPKGPGCRAVFSDLEWQDTAISNFRFGK